MKLDLVTVAARSDRSAASTFLYYCAWQRRADDAHCSRAGLLCLESSHNRCGGVVLSLNYMSRVKQWADQLGIPVHLDGARVFNAAEALGVSVAEIASHVTSVQFCLSKVCSGLPLEVHQPIDM